MRAADRLMPLALLGAAVVVGLVIGWIDSRPTWDDTGITVGMLLLGSAAFGVLGQRRAWLWGLAIGVWPGLFAMVAGRGYAALVALPIALVGAYAGALVRKALAGEAGGGRP